MEILKAQLNGRVPVTRFRLTGDFSDGAALLRVAKSAVEEGASYILLDLTAVPFISSAGLRTIYSIYELFPTSESDEKVSQKIADGSYKSPNLKLLNPSKNGLKALSVGGFDMFLDIFYTEEEALNAF